MSCYINGKLSLIEKFLIAILEARDFESCEVHGYMIYDVFTCYKIKYNDSYYEISSAIDDNVVCERIKGENNNEFIDFLDIINYMNSDRIRIINEQLKPLKEEIRKLINGDGDITEKLILKVVKKELKKYKQSCK